ncbi:MAG: hypothetical protein ACYDA9_00990 [Terriglobia bacterium]
MTKRTLTKTFFQAVTIIFFSAATLMGAKAERWIHVRVENVKGVSGGMSVNLPIEMASAALSSIPNDHHEGKFHLEGSVNGTDLRALLDAVRRSPDNVFVTMERRDKEVSVAKSGRSLLIKIVDRPEVPNHFDKTVAIRVPVSVVRAMLGGNSNELDVAAGIRALAREGEVDVTMNNENQMVRVWTDTRSTSE